MASQYRISGARVGNQRTNIADILCIGCQKGSTSWLHSVLNRHPDTWAFPHSSPITSTNKEAHFWDRNHDRGVEWYRDLMTPPDPGLKTLDFTPEYAFMREKDIDECKRLSPAARVIYILRDPLARAVSAFRMHMLWRFGAGATVRLDLKLLSEMLPQLKLDAHGFYVRNAEAWKRRYPDMLVVNYEALHADRESAVAALMAHAGLDAEKLVGEHRQAFERILSGKVWESERFEVDRDALHFLHGYTARTRTAARKAFGFEFAEGQQMLDAAEVPASSCVAQLRDELSTTQKIVESQQTTLRVLRKEVQSQKQLVRWSLEHSTADLMRDVADTLSNLQISMAETLERVHDERLSLSRFGDGEILLATTPEHNIGFQQSTPQLRKDLVAALNPDWLTSGRVMVTLPPPFVGNLHWLGVWIKVWRDLSNLLHHGKQYGNTLVSRPSFFQEEGEAGVAQWRRLWEGRPILIVTGKARASTSCHPCLLPPAPSSLCIPPRSMLILKSTMSMRKRLNARGVTHWSFFPSVQRRLFSPIASHQKGYRR